MEYTEIFTAFRQPHPYYEGPYTAFTPVSASPLEADSNVVPRRLRIQTDGFQGLSLLTPTNP